MQPILGGTVVTSWPLMILLYTDLQAFYISKPKRFTDNAEYGMKAGK